MLSGWKWLNNSSNKYWRQICRKPVKNGCNKIPIGLIKQSLLNCFLKICVKFFIKPPPCFLKPQTRAHPFSLRYNEELYHLVLISRKSWKFAKGHDDEESERCRSVKWKRCCRMRLSIVRNVAYKYKISPWEPIRRAVNRLSAELGPTEVVGFVAWWQTCKSEDWRKYKKQRSVSCSSIIRAFSIYGSMTQSGPSPAAPGFYSNAFKIQTFLPIGDKVSHKGFNTSICNDPSDITWNNLKQRKRFLGFADADCSSRVTDADNSC